MQVGLEGPRGERADPSALVRQVVAGDAAAQETFLAGPYGGVVMETARRYRESVGRRDRLWSGDDLAQEALVHLVEPSCKRCERGRKRRPEEEICGGCERDWWVLRRWLELPVGECSLEVWLITLTKRLCNTIYGAAGRQPTVEEVDVESLCRNDLVPLSGEDEALVWASLERLPSGDAAVLRLRWEGYSTKEIARKLGITEAAANSRMNRAVQRAKAVSERPGGRQENAPGECLTIDGGEGASRG